VRNNNIRYSRKITIDTELTLFEAV